MKSHWEERLYTVVVALHPRSFRTEYGEEMKLMLNDMLKDPQTPRWRVWMAVLDDVGNLMSGGVKLGLAGGAVVIATWLVHRETGMDPWFSFGIIGLTYVVVGFVGARRSGFVRGVGAGVVAGAVSALTFPGDAVFFGHGWMYSEMFVGILVISTCEGVALVLLGATIARFADIQRRVRRSALAFASAWVAA